MLVEVKDLHKAFGETKALDGLSFQARDGVAFGLLGRNGAGKTTCIRIMMDIFKGDDGAVFFDGLPPEKSRCRVGYLPEERGLYPKIKIIDQMVYIGMLRGLTQAAARKNAEAMLEELEATNYLNQKLMTLSKGNQQKIQLAISLMAEPDIVILDEPFSGLDPVNAQLLKDMVRRQVEKGKTVIFSSHQMAQVEEFCDEICIVDRGRDVLKGNLTQIKKSYPRNHILIDPGQDAPPDFAARLAAALPLRSIGRLGDCYEAVLPDANMRGQLLAALSNLGIVPEIFVVREPSLEQIFVEKVGKGEQ